MTEKLRKLPVKTKLLNVAMFIIGITLPYIFEYMSNYSRYKMAIWDAENYCVELKILHYGFMIIAIAVFMLYEFILMDIIGNKFSGRVGTVIKIGSYLFFFLVLSYLLIALSSVYLTSTNCREIDLGIYLNFIYVFFVLSLINTIFTSPEKSILDKIKRL